MIPDVWKFGAFAAMAGVVICLIAGLVVTRANLKAELAQVRADYILCKNANADWAAKVETSHAAIKKMQEEAAARHSKAVESQSRAAQTAGRHASHARDILMSTPNGDECQAVSSLVRHYLRGRP